MEIAGVADRTESAVGSKEEPTWSEDGTVPVVLDDTMTRPGVENGFPRGQTREGGSLTIAPASAAREIPGWPESVLEATPGSGGGLTWWVIPRDARSPSSAITMAGSRGRRYQASHGPSAWLIWESRVSASTTVECFAWNPP